ncbi:MAG: glycerol-3-phosphate 1-O-acyltransferase PlsY [Candidatus Omnitrophica bacterium]|nr:glycerol-3-phosphate 1-O-acyltransferase PlsY [Candidatus Omnitrophota bacterium]
MNMLNWFLIAVVSYLLGSIPTAFIFGKVMKGIDIREHGSGNMGATNAFRVLGKLPGSAVLILDMLKGLIPVVLVAGWLSPGVEGRIVAAVSVVCGHNWTCFLGFKGGKGVATSAGVLIGLTIALPAVRWPVGLCLLSWLGCFLATAYISVSSILAAILLPVFMIAFSAPFAVILLSILFCVLVVVRHQPNIHRLLNGQETKVPLPFHKKVSRP